MSVSYIRIAKASKPKKEAKKSRGFEEGYKALEPYVRNVVQSFVKEESDDYEDLYNRLIFANNYLLAQKMNISEGKMSDDWFYEPIMTRPLIKHIERVVRRFPEVGNVKTQDEKENGALQELSSVRDDITQHINEIDSNNFRSVKGVYQSLAQRAHPVLTAVEPLLPLDAFDMPKGFTRPASKVEMDDEEKEKYGDLENLSSRKRIPEKRLDDQYKEFFEEVADATGRFRAPFRFKARTATTKRISERIEQIKNEQAVDDKKAYNILQNEFNVFGDKLTGYQVTEDNPMVTPSMEVVANEIGIKTRANTPDVIISSFMDGNDPYDDNTRFRIGEYLEENASPEDSDLHPNIINAMSEGDSLSGSMMGDERVSLPSNQLGFEEGGRTPAEARAGVGTEQGLFGDRRKRELAHIRGGERSRVISPSKQMTMLEIMFRHGDIDEYDYNMQKQMLLLGGNLHNFDSEEPLGGLRPSDFSAEHNLSKENLEKIQQIANSFTENLFSMGRIQRKLARDILDKAGYGESQEDLREGMKKHKDLFNAETLGALIEVEAKTRPIQSYEEKIQKNVVKLQQLAGGDVNELTNKYINQMSKQIDKMQELGLSRGDLLKAAVEYSNNDFTPEGFDKAMNFLEARTKTNKISDYAINRLLRYIKFNGEREALDNAHHRSLAHQDERFTKNTRRRKKLGIGEDDGIEDFSKLTDDDREHLLTDAEECEGCKSERYVNREKAETYLHSPLRKQRTHHKHKYMQVPFLEKYKTADGSENDLYAFDSFNESETTLQKIVNFIFPDNSRYNYDNMKQRFERAKNKGSWSNNEKKKMKRIIRNAVISGNPRAQNVYNKFGLTKVGENTIATGSAGMSNQEIASVSLAFPNFDAHDKHTENARRRTINALRYDAFDNAIDLIKAVREGRIIGMDGRPLKLRSIKGFEKEAFRRSLLEKIFQQPIAGAAKEVAKLGKIGTSEEDIGQGLLGKLQQIQPKMNEYDKKMSVLKQRLADTKPMKVKEEGIVRTYAPKITNPKHIEDIKKDIENLKQQYAKTTRYYNTLNREIEKSRNRLQKYKKYSQSTSERHNDYARAAFVKFGSELEKISKLDDEDERNTELRKLMKKAYADTDDGIFMADKAGNVSRDFRHMLSNYKLGKHGEFAGIGIRGFESNLGIPRINDMNTLRAFRLYNHLPNLSDEDKEKLESLHEDSDFSLDDFDLDGKDVVNHAEIDHPHHDNKPDENQLLTESEMRKRHQNSHFTRNSVEDIKNGKIDVNLASNWKELAPRLCGTCHGHGHVSRAEMGSYLRHHVPELENEPTNSPKMKRWIANNCRPRDTANWEAHEMYDDEEHPMEADDHEQLACIDCEYEDDGVVGGKVSNGICSHCFGNGVRDPNDDDYIQNGYQSNDGTYVKGRNHHHTSNSIAGDKADLLNQMVSTMFDTGSPTCVKCEGKGVRTWKNQFGSGSKTCENCEGSGIAMPPYLQDILPTPTLSDKVYEDTKNRGLFTPLEDQLAMRRAKHTKPLPSKKELNQPLTGTALPTKESIERQKLLDLEARLKRKPQIELPTPLPAKPQIELPTALPSVHDVFANNHLRKVLTDRVEHLKKSAMMSDIPQKEIDKLVDKILNHPNMLDMHENEQHELTEALDQLQDYADSRFVNIDSMFEETPLVLGKKGEIVSRPTYGMRQPQIPFGQMSAENIRSEGTPINKFEFEPLRFRNGRFVSQTEDQLDLFNPTTVNKLPEPTISQLKKYYRNAPNELRKIEKYQNSKKYDEGVVQKIRDVLSKEEKPMQGKQATGLVSDDLNKMLALFKKPSQEPVETEPALGWSDEVMQKLKEAGINKSNLDKYLHVMGDRNRQEPLDSSYSKELSRAIKPMWVDYVKHAALYHFLTQYAAHDKYSYPYLEGVTPENFVAKTQENPNLQKLALDDAVKVITNNNGDRMFDGVNDLEKKLKMQSNIKIGNKEFKPKEFKEKILNNENFTINSKTKYPLAQYFMQLVEKNGREVMVPKFRRLDLEETLQAAKNNQFDEQTESDFQKLTNSYKYDIAPNYMYENLLTNIMNDTGYSYDDLSKLYAAQMKGESKVLSDDVMSALNEGRANAYSHHPNWRPTNYNSTLQYDEAMNQKAAQGERIKQQQMLQQQQKEQQQNVPMFTANRQEGEFETSMGGENS